MQVAPEPAAHAERIPDELMQRFHDANARFHESRQRLEESMAGSEYRHVERVEAAHDEIRQAERDVEAVEEQIRRRMEGQAH